MYGIYENLLVECGIAEWAEGHGPDSVPANEGDKRVIILHPELIIRLACMVLAVTTYPQLWL